MKLAQRVVEAVDDARLGAAATFYFRRDPDVALDSRLARRGDTAGDALLVAV